MGLPFPLVRRDEVGGYVINAAVVISNTNEPSKPAAGGMNAGGDGAGRSAGDVCPAANGWRRPVAVEFVVVELGRLPRKSFGHGVGAKTVSGLGILG